MQEMDWSRELQVLQMAELLIPTPQPLWQVHVLALTTVPQLTSPSPAPHLLSLCLEV
jgi:hypothetical protein